MENEPDVNNKHETEAGSPSEPAVDNGSTAPIAKKPKNKKKAEKDPVLAALKVKYSFYKWFLGSFVIGLFTAITTFILKDYQLKLQTREKESAYLQPYFDSYMKLFAKNTLGYDKAADMAKFLSCAVVDKDYKAGWNDLYIYCQQRIGQLKMQNDSITRDSVATAKKLNHFKQAEAKTINGPDGGKHIGNGVQLQIIRDSIAKLTTQLSVQNAVKTSNSNKIDPQPNNSPTDHPVKQAPTETTAIITPQVGNQYIQVENATKVISKSYAQTFNGNFDITVNSVSVHNATVNVRFSMVANGYITSVLQDDVDLDKGASTTLYSPDSSFKYVITVVDLYTSRLRSYAKFQVASFKKS